MDRHTKSSLLNYKRIHRELQRVISAILQSSKSDAQKFTDLTVSKIGAAGAASGVYGIAALLGTAKTGTAISALSGAAASNATLAWLGGSVATGTGVLLAIAVLGSRFAKRIWRGKRRKQGSLSPEESHILGVAAFLSEALSDCLQKKETFRPSDEEAFRRELLEPFIELLLKYQKKRQKPINRANSFRLLNAATNLSRYAGRLAVAGTSLPSNHSAAKGLQKEIKSKQEGKSHSEKNFTEKNVLSAGAEMFAIGVLPAVFLKLLSGNPEELKFSPKEGLVLDAIRRSSRELSDASIEEIADHISAMSPEQMQGFANNIKGIYHELAFVDAENSDGDDFIAEVFAKTNEPGADVRILDTQSGNIEEFQLKATDSTDYIQEHLERYPTIPVFATEEVAEQFEGNPEIKGSGFSNAELSGDLSETLEVLADATDSKLVESAILSAGLSALRQAYLLLHQKSTSKEALRRICRDAGIGAAASAAFEVLF